MVWKTITIVPLPDIAQRKPRHRPLLGLLVHVLVENVDVIKLRPAHAENSADRDQRPEDHVDQERVALGRLGHGVVGGPVGLVEADHERRLVDLSCGQDRLNIALVARVTRFHDSGADLSELPADVLFWDGDEQLAVVQKSEVEIEKRWRLSVVSNEWFCHC